MTDSLAMSAARLISSAAAYSYAGKTRGPAKSAFFQKQHTTVLDGRGFVQVFAAQIGKSPRWLGCFRLDDSPPISERHEHTRSLLERNSALQRVLCIELFMLTMVQ